MNKLILYYVKYYSEKMAYGNYASCWNIYSVIFLLSFSWFGEVVGREWYKVVIQRHFASFFNLYYLHLLIECLWVNLMLRSFFFLSRNLTKTGPFGPTLSSKPKIHYPTRQNHLLGNPITISKLLEGFPFFRLIIKEKI